MLPFEIRAIVPSCFNDYAVRGKSLLTAFSTCTLLCRRAKISPSVWRLPNAHCICGTVERISHKNVLPLHLCGNTTPHPMPAFCSHPYRAPPRKILNKIGKEYPFGRFIRDQIPRRRGLEGWKLNRSKILFIVSRKARCFCFKHHIAG